MATDQHASATAFLRGGGAMGELIAGHDWAATPLGPISGWADSLKTATALILQASLPMILHWGEDGLMIFNNGYAALAGAVHRQLLGARVREAMPEFADLADRGVRTGLAGRALAYRDLELTSTPTGRQVWVNLDYSPVPDDDGRPAGVLAIVVNTTERVLAQRRAAAQAERQRRMFEQAPGFISLTRGPDHVFEFANEAFKRLIGREDIVGRRLLEVFAATAKQGLSGKFDGVYASGDRYVGRGEQIFLEKQPGGPDEEHFLDFILQPVAGEDGGVGGMFVEGFDVTEQVRAQHAAEESHRRLSAAVAVARLGVFEWDVTSGQAMLDGRAREIFGFGPSEDITYQDLVARIDPEDLSRLQTACANAAAGNTRREMEYRIRLPDGAERDVATISDSICGPDGRTRRIIGVFDDVTERRRAEKRQRLLINELNHRVKNTLATVQSIAAQTLRSAHDPPSALEAFEGRLVALAAAHDLLTTQSWHGARLADVVANALAPFEAVQRSQISRAGAPVWLSAQRALALSLALHELATNAAKYGALSRPEGRVTIRWSETAAGELTLSWLEQGGPPVMAPVRSGFGSRLLQRSLARELAGEVAFAFAPEGIRCEIRCKIEDIRLAASETADI